MITTAPLTASAGSADAVFLFHRSLLVQGAGRDQTLPFRASCCSVPDLSQRRKARKVKYCTLFPNQAAWRDALSLSVCRPAHGWEFSSDGKQNKLSDYFGIELSFAKKLQEYYPNEKIAIIKYSRGGTSIDSVAAGRYGSWEPDYKGKNGINQYDHFLRTVNLAMNDKDIDNNGIEDYLIPSGIIWMQGESDAYREEVALRYYGNLKRLMDLVRAALRKDDLPIVIGKISDSGNTKAGKVYRYGELVQYAQEKFARTEQNVYDCKKYATLQLLRCVSLRQ